MCARFAIYGAPVSDLGGATCFYVRDRGPSIGGRGSKSILDSAVKVHESDRFCPISTNSPNSQYVSRLDRTVTITTPRDHPNNSTIWTHFGAKRSCPRPHLDRAVIDLYEVGPFCITHMTADTTTGPPIVPTLSNLRSSTEATGGMVQVTETLESAFGSRIPRISTGIAEQGQDRRSHIAQVTKRW